MTSTTTASPPNTQPNTHGRSDPNLESQAKKDTHNTIGKIVCVGRNYAAHAAELGNAVPTRPLLFIKPASSAVGFEQPISAHFHDIPRDKHYPVHYETELCIRLGRDLKNANTKEVMAMPDLIDGVTLGLDLTLRDLQNELKEQGQPWERAKCFAGAAVLGEWVDPATFGDFTAISYQLYINNKITQDGDTSMMLFPLYELLSEISYAFGLQAGDVIMTGTPSGVGVLTSGDDIKLTLGGHTWQTQVV